MNHTQNNKTVCVIGLGYVGLPLSLTFLKKEFLKRVIKYYNSNYQHKLVKN